MTTKRSDKIAELIRQRILTGELKPGQALSNEAALIDRFSTSKWTLREALKSLETQGLIKIRSGPGGGASVTEVGADKANELLWNYCFSRELTLENIYALRKELEPLLAAQVTPLLSDDDLTRLSAMAERCCAYKPTGRGQPERATELDFHNLLAKRCPNPLLGFLIEFINELLMRIVEAQHLDPVLARHDLNYHGHDYHLDLIEAFRRRDAEQARQLMHEHMVAAEKHMLDLASLCSSSAVPHQETSCSKETSESATEPGGTHAGT